MGCPATRHDDVMVQKGRLPDKSRFNVVYDAAKEQWFGTLEIVLPDRVKVFEAVASGEFKLLTCLDTQYRRWQAAQETSPGE
jgi:hypothetical protein